MKGMRVPNHKFCGSGHRRTNAEIKTNPLLNTSKFDPIRANENVLDPP